MSKLLIIGIDSLDSRLLLRFQDDLPTFTRLMGECPPLRLRGVYPPDSPVSWASIFTGENPARHGILEFVDPLDKTTMRVSKEIDNSGLRGKTFWDIAGKAGRKRVCILLPAVGFPVWPVNGVMAGRSSVSDAVQVYPSDCVTAADLAGLTNLKGVIGRSPERFIDRGRKLIRREMEFSLQMLRRGDWDLFFTYSSVLDPIQHGFWNTFDERDPSYQAGNRFHDVIRDFYIIYDSVVERYLQSIDGETAVIVLSDHGHGMRPVRLVNVNEILRREGLFQLRQVKAGPVISILEKAKRLLLNVIVKFRLGNLALFFMRAVPGSKRVYTSPLSIDWNRTVAYLSDQSGIKAYTYGGIKVEENRDGQGMPYEAVRELIIQRLSAFSDPETGRPCVKWIRRREDLYSGPYLSKYPDIIFRLQDEFGAGWPADGSLVGSSLSHNIQPGSHNEETPIFLMRNVPGRKLVRQDMTLMDVAPTVLDILEMERMSGWEGASIFQ
jgi:predicted AlkP superfamily phosphohydrolase/phosphomutase